MITVFFDEHGRIDTLIREYVPQENVQSTAVYRSKTLEIDYETGIVTVIRKSGSETEERSSFQTQVYESPKFGRFMECEGLSLIYAVSQQPDKTYPVELFSKNSDYLGVLAPADFSRYGSFYYSGETSVFTTYDRGDPYVPHFVDTFEQYKIIESMFYRSINSRVQTVYQPENSEQYETISENIDTGYISEYKNIFQMLYDKNDLRTFYSRYVEGERGEIIEATYLPRLNS